MTRIASEPWYGGRKAEPVGLRYSIRTTSFFIYLYVGVLLTIFLTTDVEHTYFPDIIKFICVLVTLRFSYK